MFLPAFDEFIEKEKERGKGKGTQVYPYEYKQKVRPWRHAILRPSKEAIRLQIEMEDLFEINGK
jgi:hypothetical protein